MEEPVVEEPATEEPLEEEPTVDLDALTEAGFDDPDWDAEIQEYWETE